MNIVLLGAPGSGKGTQASLISKQFNLYYLQTGALARKWAETDTRIAGMVSRGELIPEEEMTKFVMKYLNENAPERSNILFEGFPRFISQYNEYEKWLAEKDQKIDLVVSLDLTEEAAIRRLSSRRTCKVCGEVYNVVTNPTKIEGVCDKCGGELYIREDDKPESIKVRFEYYRANTYKLIEYLDGLGKLFRVDADRPINDINQDITGKIKQLK